MTEVLHDSAQRLVGIKSVIRAVRSGTAARVFVARDAAGAILSPVLAACEAAGVAVEEVATMAELGRDCGIDVGAAAACLLRTR